MKTVSAIVPCYNHGRYIGQTVDSLLTQTLPPNEILILDDGSTDGHTRAVLNEVNDPRIRVIRTENRGPASARNTAFRASSGDHILLLDADDMFHPSFVKKATDILERYPRVGAVSAWSLLFGYEDYIWYPVGGGLSDFVSSITAPACSLVKRTAWTDAGGFDESYTIGYEDWDFWIRITKKKWLVYIIPELLFYYRQKKQSRVKETYRLHTEIYKKIMQKHPDVFHNRKGIRKEQ